ncbi:MAG: FAD-dependent oxidoreductase [Bradymonadaceae bacterium]
MEAIDFSAQAHLGDRLQTAATWAGDTASIERTTLEVDAVVVGAGPAGLSTAWVFAEHGLSVAVLEAGQFWTFDEFERDQTWATEHLYQEKGTRVAKGNALIPLASGRGVGGGTLVNSGICFRAPDRVLDRWHGEFGVDFWGPGAREAIFEEVESALGVAPTSPSVAGGNTEVARRGFAAMDVDHGYMPRNTPGCAGCGTCQTGCPVGGKASADLNWLPAMLDAGGRVFADTRVDRIDVRDGIARGVSGTMRDPETDEVVAELDVRANRVVLAAGAINTPMLLKRQGLANSSGQVGRNLHIHPGNSVLAHMPDDVIIWDGATQGYYAHHPTDPDLIAETFSAPPEALYAPGGGVGFESIKFLKRLKKIAGCGAIIRDESSGTVDPGNGVKADVSYRLTPADTEKLIQSFLFVTEMFFEAGARAVKPLFAGSEFYESRQRARTAILEANAPSDMTLYASHPLGTCRMSADPARGVVDPENGETHDIDGLHVTDSSTLPSALGVNPQVTIMGTALSLARGIVRRS